MKERDGKNREGEEQSLECGRIGQKLEGKEIIIVSVLIILCVIAINGMEDHFSETFSTLRVERENAEQVTVSPKF